MKHTAGKLMSATAGLIVLYLLVQNSFGASKVLGAFTDFYTRSVKTLQGR